MHSDFPKKMKWIFGLMQIKGTYFVQTHSRFDVTFIWNVEWLRVLARGRVHDGTSAQRNTDECQSGGTFYLKFFEQLLKIASALSFDMNISGKSKTCKNGLNPSFPHPKLKQYSHFSALLCYPFSPGQKISF